MKYIFIKVGCRSAKTLSILEIINQHKSDNKENIYALKSIKRDKILFNM